jgi:signal transduction histidine kinase
MRPDGFRNVWRFAGCSGAVLILAIASPALANPLNSPAVVSNAPFAVALGAAGFALLAMLALRRLVRESKIARRQAGEQIAGLRAELDEHEALLASAQEITVLWNEQGAPRVFGQAPLVLPAGRRTEAILDFRQWLAEADVPRLAAAVEGLRMRGDGFSLDLRARDGATLRVSGMASALGAVMRVRRARDKAVSPPAASGGDADLRATLTVLDFPAFIRDADRRLVFANAAYQALAEKLRLKSPQTAPAELPETGPAGASPLTLAGRHFERVEFALATGSAGYLRPMAEPITPTLAKPQTGQAAALIAALRIPAALFDANHQLTVFNDAYAELWKLGDWLKPGLDERLILDRLRREGLLPSEADYQGWRTRHLASYAQTGSRVEAWHLPDGRMLNVTAAPAGTEGGVIYLFEDVSREMELVSQNRALLSVQRSTLNALSDAVAVFGTNGRLQLFNPRLSALWRLPVNFLDQHPHIDRIADEVAKDLPEDGARIWREVKRAIIDLSPTRTDLSGRLTRSDGRLLDYAVVRLPDGQKLLTFLDVTESANYSRVLTERNDALVTADRLKDAFVQNVSYELRSPLTNIIGFADLLASSEVGPLNERQRAYTDYIRASSVTLGVLIDNILDLATVDAGIAELKPEPQDVPTLIEKARAGLAASFPDLGDGSAVSLKVTIAPDLPPFIADGTRLVQVLYNLLSSAARYSEPGGEIRLSVTTRGGRMVFAIEDDGVAVSEELRAALTDRPDSAGAGRDRGAGLGLAIVRTFVSLHGGTISVDKRNAKGSRVVVSLPLDASAITTAAE